MKVLSKIALIFIVIFLLGTLLTACNSDDEEQSAEKNVSQSEEKNDQNIGSEENEKPDGWVDDSGEDFQGGDIIVVG